MPQTLRASLLSRARIGGLGLSQGAVAERNASNEWTRISRDVRKKS
jgi:hypothetical protein